MSPLKVASAYAILANGGYQVEPHLIDRVTDLQGETVYRTRPATVCRDCDQPEELEEELSIEEIMARGPVEKTEPLPEAPRVMEARINFIIDSILKDVITRGTGRRALVLERSDIAGKTGTTNGPMDAWFSGYNRDVVTTTWVGFDNYTPLGREEFGGTAALPIWIEFMRQALKDSPDVPRQVPPGIVHVRIDPATGLLASPSQEKSMFEYFREELVPEPGDINRGPDPLIGTTDDLVLDIFN